MANKNRGTPAALWIHTTDENSEQLPVGADNPIPTSSVSAAPVEAQANAFNAALSGPAKAELDLGTLAAGNLDTVVEATTAGTAGNSITIAAAGDSPPAGGVTIARVGTTFIIHYETGVSTVANVEAAITALAGADDLFGVKTGGTGATVLAVATDDFAATALAGGRSGFSTSVLATGGNISIFGSVNGATTLTAQVSQDNVTFFDTATNVVLGGAGDFHLNFNTAAKYVRLKSSADVTITATISTRA